MQDSNENRERKIKRHLYGTPQSVEVIFPPGFSEIAIHEVNAILNTPWFEPKSVASITRTPQALRIDNIHLFSVMELLLRSLCLTDIRLVILETKAAGNFSFEKKCGAVAWQDFLARDMDVKLRVRSIASRAFHESGLKERLADIVSAYANIVTGEEEATCLYADLNKNRLTLSLSLAGAPLYKRGYRGVLAQSAPLREDAAACCLQKAIAFATTLQPEYVPDEYLIPFSGTGTFLLESLLQRWQIAPCLLGRDYAIQKMPFFREKHFAYLIKKAKHFCKLQDNPMPLHFNVIDTGATAISALNDNMDRMQRALAANELRWPEAAFHLQQQQNDFLQCDLMAQAQKNIFLPLNPPYGLRMRKQQDSNAFYHDIAIKIHSLSKSAQTLAGFILCPSESTWSAFSNGLRDAKKQTYHFTQGGLDIRVCQFFYQAHGPS